MIVRQASSKDIDEIVRLNEQLGYSTSDEYLYQQLENPSLLCLISEDNGKITGMAATIFFDYFHDEIKIARLDAIIIDQTCKRKGYGQSLLQETEKQAKKCGAAFIELSSALHRQKDGTYDFYRNEGYIDQTEAGTTYFRKYL